MASHAQKRRSFTVENKLEIIRAARAEPIRDVATRFSVRPQQIRAWEHQEDSLLHLPVTLHRIPGAGRPSTQQTTPSSSEHAPANILVGFHGQQGSFGDVAAQKLSRMVDASEQLDHKRIITIGFAKISLMISAIENQCINYAVVSRDDLAYAVLHGTNQFTGRHITIVNEIILKMEECLCTLANAQLNAIDTVLSDANTLHRCENFISQLELDNGFLIVNQATWDSAAACEIIKMENQDCMAVITTKQAASIHGLKIQATNTTNPTARASTQFVIGDESALPFPVYSPLNHKTKSSILLAVPSQAFQLSSILAVFNRHNIHVVSVMTDANALREDGQP